MKNPWSITESSFIVFFISILAIPSCEDTINITVPPPTVIVQPPEGTNSLFTVKLTSLEIQSCNLCATVPTLFDKDVQVDIDYQNSGDRPLFLGVVHEAFREITGSGPMSYEMNRKLEFIVPDSAIRVRIGPVMEAHNSQQSADATAFEFQILRTNGVWHYNSPGQTDIKQGASGGTLRWEAAIRYSIDID